MLSTAIHKSTALVSRLNLTSRRATSSFLKNVTFIPSYYKINDLIWQDGLLIDFLQKKVIDKWIRRFLICSSYIFSERTLFQFVVRFYIDAVVWPFRLGSIYEAPNVSFLLSLTSSVIALFIVLLNLNYLFILIL